MERKSPLRVICKPRNTFNFINFKKEYTVTKQIQN